MLQCFPCFFVCDINVNMYFTLGIPRFYVVVVPLILAIITIEYDCSCCCWLLFVLIFCRFSFSLLSSPIYTSTLNTNNLYTMWKKRLSYSSSSRK